MTRDERRAEYIRALRDRAFSRSHFTSEEARGDWEDANDRCYRYGTPWWSDISPDLAEFLGGDGPIPG